MSLDLLSVGTAGPMGGPATAVPGGAGGQEPQPGFFQQVMEEKTGASSQGAAADSDDQTVPSSTSDTPPIGGSAAPKAGRAGHTHGTPATHARAHSTTLLVPFVVTLLPSADQSDPMAAADDPPSAFSESATSDRKEEPNAKILSTDKDTPSVVVSTAASPQPQPCAPVAAAADSGAPPAPPSFASENDTASASTAENTPSARDRSTGSRSSRSTASDSTPADGNTNGRTPAAPAPVPPIDVSAPAPISEIPTPEVTAPAAASAPAGGQIATAEKQDVPRATAAPQTVASPGQWGPRARTAATAAAGQPATPRASAKIQPDASADTPESVVAVAGDGARDVDLATKNGQQSSTAASVVSTNTTQPTAPRTVLAEDTLQTTMPAAATAVDIARVVPGAEDRVHQRGAAPQAPVATATSTAAGDGGLSAVTVPRSGIVDITFDAAKPGAETSDFASPLDPAALVARAVTARQPSIAAQPNTGATHVTPAVQDAKAPALPVIDLQASVRAEQQVASAAALVTAADFGLNTLRDAAGAMPANAAAATAALLQAQLQARAATQLVDALGQARLPAMPLVAPAAAVQEFTRNAGSGSSPRFSPDSEFSTRATSRAATVASASGDTQFTASSTAASPAATERPAVASPSLVPAPQIPNEDRNTASIVQAIRMQWTNGTGRAVVNLDPSYLGEVRIALQVGQGNITATVHAANADVRGWLQTNEPALRQGLAAQGLTLDRLVVLDETASDEREQPDGRRRQQEPDAEARRAPRRAPAGTFNVVV